MNSGSSIEDALAAEDLHRALEEANKSRAMLYLAVFNAVARRFGRESAAEVLTEAVRDWGVGLGRGLEHLAPNDWDGLTAAFVTAPDGGAIFDPLVLRRDGDALEVVFQSCPLKAAWLEAGLPDEEVALFCRMASQADYGALEAAGFDVSIQSWRSGVKGCCRLQIRRRCSGPT